MARSLGPSSISCGFSWCFFFFSSRRRHTRLTCDWSSDVCSSDLRLQFGFGPARRVDGLQLRTEFANDPPKRRGQHLEFVFTRARSAPDQGNPAKPVIRTERFRSEERRVGKECRSRWWPYH